MEWRKGVWVGGLTTQTLLALPLMKAAAVHVHVILALLCPCNAGEADEITNP